MRVLRVVALVAAISALAAGVAAGVAGARRTDSCPSVLAGRTDVGRLAFVGRGQLRLVDLATCRSRTLVARDVEPPVRWSADGRYLAYGAGSVVSAGGGAPTRPLGRLAARPPLGRRHCRRRCSRRRPGRGDEAAVAGRLGRDEHRLVAERADARGVTLALPKGAASLRPGDLAARPAQRHQDAAVPPRKARASAALAVRLLAGWALAAGLGRQPELCLARRRRGAADRAPRKGRQSSRSREGDAHLRRLRLLVHRQRARLRAQPRRPRSHAGRPDQLRRAATAVAGRHAVTRSRSEGRPELRLARLLAGRPLHGRGRSRPGNAGRAVWPRAPHDLAALLHRRKLAPT